MNFGNFRFVFLNFYPLFTVELYLTVYKCNLDCFFFIVISTVNRQNVASLCSCAQCHEEVARQLNVRRRKRGIIQLQACAATRCKGINKIPACLILRECVAFQSVKEYLRCATICRCANLRCRIGRVYNFGFNFYPLFAVELYLTVYKCNLDCFFFIVISTVNRQNVASLCSCAQCHEEVARQLNVRRRKRGIIQLQACAATRCKGINKIPACLILRECVAFQSVKEYLRCATICRCANLRCRIGRVYNFGFNFYPVFTIERKRRFFDNVLNRKFCIIECATDYEYVASNSRRTQANVHVVRDLNIAHADLRTVNRYANARTADKVQFFSPSAVRCLKRRAACFLKVNCRCFATAVDCNLTDFVGSRFCINRPN